MEDDILISFQNIELRHQKVVNLIPNNRRILDIGFSAHPNKYLKGSIVGYDIQKPTKNPSNYSEFVYDDVFNINKYSKEESFDIIIGLEFIEHIDKHMTFFHNMYRLLKKEGLLIISTPTPYYYKTVIGNIFFFRGTTSNKDHISIYIPRILNNIMKDFGFDLIKLIPATRIYLPFFTWQLIYIYRKK